MTESTCAIGSHGILEEVRRDVHRFHPIAAVLEAAHCRNSGTIIHWKITIVPSHKIVTSCTALVGSP